MRNDPIPIDPSLLHLHGREKTERCLRNIVRSVRFELLEQEAAIRLLGPDMGYHNTDPHLVKVLEAYKKNMSSFDVLSYKSRARVFDLCFEDCWTGFFIAKPPSRQCRHVDFVLIHLDDHADMMPTLLTRADGALINPTTGAVFDPTASRDWETAIYSGCVSIGNFITPLFYSGHRLHVRHINNDKTGTYELQNVSRHSCCYPLIPNFEFAAIRKSNSTQPNGSGTYLGGADAARVLQHLPEGQVVVHIDLDYFINDYKGNLTVADSVPDHDLVDEARRKMDCFFNALRMLRSGVDHWIVATSPGFCSARHWDWLLSEIERRIQLCEALT